jgi:hypothetical protein
MPMAHRGPRTRDSMSPGPPNRVGNQTYAMNVCDQGHGIGRPVPVASAGGGVAHPVVVDTVMGASATHCAFPQRAEQPSTSCCRYDSHCRGAAHHWPARFWVAGTEVKSIIKGSTMSLPWGPSGPYSFHGDVQVTTTSVLIRMKRGHRSPVRPAEPPPVSRLARPTVQLSRMASIGLVGLARFELATP